MSSLPIEERTFDRLPSKPDPVRMRNFAMRSATVGTKLRSYTWKHVQLDQGAEGACTGFGVTMEAAAKPKPVWGDPSRAIMASRGRAPDVKKLIRGSSSPYPIISVLNQIAREAYYENRRTDEWPGENYEGSSVAAGMATGKRYGWWDGYVWADQINPNVAAAEVCLALSVGPVVVGSDWLTGMQADSEGFFRIEGELLGGHCYLLTSYNIRTDSVWTPNSWGGAGQGRITRAGLVTLFERGAEAAIPVGRRLLPAPL